MILRMEGEVIIFSGVEGTLTQEISKLLLTKSGWIEALR